MPAPPSPDQTSTAATSIGPISATALLADRASRSIVGALGDARPTPLDAAGIADSVLFAATPRLVRDRLRTLERSGITYAVSRARSDGSEPTRWSLTGPGRDLHRLLSLIARITAHAAQLPENAPARIAEPMVGCALESLSDPAVLTIGRFLAGVESVEPLELEAACPGIPRRTLYRRLAPLVDAGVVTRRTTRKVPRSTTYALADRWRPAVAILVLTAWWEARHREDDTPFGPLDLRGVVAVVAPTARHRAAEDSTVTRWIVTGAVGEEQRFVVAVAGGKVRAGAPGADDATIAATLSGSAGAWTSALIEGLQGALGIAGSPEAAEAHLATVRSALLAYVR